MKPVEVSFKPVDNRRLANLCGTHDENPRRIEAALDDTGETATAVAVICHPHPLQLGTMQNKVVTTLARSFANLGATAVRFNFRGVGASAGGYARHPPSFP